MSKGREARWALAMPVDGGRHGRNSHGSLDRKPLKPAAAAATVTATQDLASSCLSVFVLLNGVKADTKDERVGEKDACTRPSGVSSVTNTGGIWDMGAVSSRCAYSTYHVGPVCDSTKQSKHL